TFRRLGDGASTRMTCPAVGRPQPVKVEGGYWQQQKSEHALCPSIRGRNLLGRWLEAGRVWIASRPGCAVDLRMGRKGMAVRTSCHRLSGKRVWLAVVAWGLTARISCGPRRGRASDRDDGRQ